MYQCLLTAMCRTHFFMSAHICIRVVFCLPPSQAIWPPGTQAAGDKASQTPFDASGTVRIVCPEVWPLDTVNICAKRPLHTLLLLHVASYACGHAALPCVLHKLGALQTTS